MASKLPVNIKKTNKTCFLLCISRNSSIYIAAICLFEIFFLITDGIKNSFLKKIFLIFISHLLFWICCSRICPLELNWRKITMLVLEVVQWCRKIYLCSGLSPHAKTPYVVIREHKQVLSFLPSKTELESRHAKSFLHLVTKNFILAHTKPVFSISPKIWICAGFPKFSLWDLPHFNELLMKYLVKCLMKTSYFNMELGITR